MKSLPKINKTKLHAIRFFDDKYENLKLKSPNPGFTPNT